MKTKKQIVRAEIRFTVRQLVLLIGLWGSGWLNAAAPSDLKTFTAEESYVVEGASIVLTQKMVEVSVKVGSAVKDPTALTAANGAKFDRERELPGGSGIYRLQSTGTVSGATAKEAIDSLNQDANVEYAYPVYVNAATGKRHFLNDEVVVRLKISFEPGQNDPVSSFKLKLIETLSASENIYVFKLTEPKDFDPFKVCDLLRQRTEVVWAEPNMAQEIQQSVIPNDTSFASQWNLRNTGQTQAFSDADVDADEAWDGSQSYGSSGIRIAIVEDGVQTTHPDLDGNIVPGFDFFGNDSDANPNHSNDNHGTAVAGLAAAEVNNNSVGVAGMAGKCKILPVRIAENGVFTSATSIYRALVYAADNADVISCSWGTSPSSTISAGFTYAYANGRGGKGCAVLCSSGNSAGGDGVNSFQTLQAWILYPTFPAGNYFFGFAYIKNASGSANDDCFWLADVKFPYGALDRFDSDILPPNWTTFGDANWAGPIDAVHAHGTTRHAWRSGTVGNSQSSFLVSPLATLDATHPTLWFRTWVSSEIGDQAKLLVFNDQSQAVGEFLIGEGPVANRTTAVSYPANLGTVLAVGACTDFDYRSHYSQYDSTLDFVVSSSGGYGYVITTDRTGIAGYDAGSDYYSTFGGTSASAALAAGTAALVLSKDGNLTRSTLVSKLTENCEKKGPVAYTGTPPLTRNDYYGYGRLNAKSSVNATTADTTAPTFTSAQTMHYRAVDVTFNEPMGEGATDASKYQIIAGQGTLTASPNKVLRILPTVYRLIWNSGDMAESGTVTIKVLSGMKDVAGNLLPANVTQNTTGTKRIIAVNCGSGLDLTGYPFFYAPPFNSDNGFQGNEPATYLTSSTPTTATTSAIDRSGVVNPAPEAVYQSIRHHWSNPATISYSIPNIPSGNKTVRLHFAEIYYNLTGDQVFDIWLYHPQGSLVYDNFDILAQTGGVKNKAYVLDLLNVSHDGSIGVQLVPQLGWTGVYNAAISGIEILKP